LVLAELQPLFCFSLAVWVWADHLVSLGFYFLIYKMGGKYVFQRIYVKLR
jgi:hypothetical protein